MMSPTNRLKRTVMGCDPANPAEFQFIFVSNNTSHAMASSDESPW
jgi:hypothetical protein